MVTLDKNNKNLCFVLMPFSKEFKNQWELSIIPAIKEAGLIPWRGDEKSLGTNTIMSDVTRSISEAMLIIADLTGKNPNVMYELGLAHAAKKPVIMLTQEKDDIPFDIKHIRYLKYDIRDLTELRKQLFDRIRHTLSMALDNNPDFFPELKIFREDDRIELEYLRNKTIKVEVSSIPPDADIFFNDRLIKSPSIISVNPDAPNNYISAAFPQHFEYHKEINEADLSAQKIGIVLEHRNYDEIEKRVPRWLRFRRIYPNNPVLMLAISIYLDFIGEHDEAMTEINELLQLFPSWYLACNQAGIIHGAQNKIDEAISFFERVTVLKPNSYLGYYNLACMYSIKSDFELCESYLHKILDSGNLLKNYCCLPNNVIANDKDMKAIKNDTDYGPKFRLIEKKFNDVFIEMNSSCDLIAKKDSPADKKNARLISNVGALLD